MVRHHGPQPRAFVPSTPDRQRNVLVDDSIWTSGSWTPSDPASIMHHPQCNGSSSDLSMTETDRRGARSVYGS